MFCGAGEPPNGMRSESAKIRYTVVYLLLIKYSFYCIVRSPKIKKLGRSYHLKGVPIKFRRGQCRLEDHFPKVHTVKIPGAVRTGLIKF